MIDIEIDMSKPKLDDGGSITVGNSNGSVYVCGESLLELLTKSGSEEYDFKP